MLVAVALAVACMPACNFLFSLDGYEGSSTSPDGAVRADAASADANADADADGRAADGNVDNGFCPAAALFCDDFERDVVLGDWTSANAGDGGLAIVSGTPTGRALHCSVPAGSTAESASLTKDTHVSITKAAKLEDSVLVPSSGSGGGVHLGQIQFGSGSETSAVFPYFVPTFGLVIGQLHCTGGTCAYQQTSPTAFTLDAWHDVALSVDFGSSPPLLKLAVDGHDVISDQALVPVVAGPMSVSAGIAIVDATHGAVDVTIDRVVVTGQ